MPSKRIINSAHKALQSIAGWPRLRVLDLSCGDGALIELLNEKGCHVEGTHFRDDDYIFKKPRDILKTAVIHRDIDLTKPLPFPDGAYDVVVATEVIEHLPIHRPLFIEISRILKTGGHCVLSTPNTHRLQSRLRFALTGQHELRSARLGWQVPPSEIYSTHYNPVYLPVMHTLLFHAGLRIKRVLFAGCKPLSLLLLPLYPLICIATAYEARHAIKRSRTGGQDLLRWMIDVRALFSNHLLLLARKMDDPSF